MDSLNYQDVIRMARDEQDRKKVDYLLNQIEQGSDAEVPDPYYGGPDGFDRVYDMMDKACDRIIEKIKSS